MNRMMFIELYPAWLRNQATFNPNYIKTTHFIKKRNTNTLYYDCTNYYFEIEEDGDFRKYGKSNENRPNPIIDMGLMMDGDGIPVSF